MKITVQTIEQGVGAWNEDAVVCLESLGFFGVYRRRDVARAVPRTGRGDRRLSGGARNRCRLHSRRTSRDRLTRDDDAIECPASRCDGRGRHLTGYPGRAMERLRGAGRVGPKWIEYAQLGDCMLAVYYADGTIRIVTHDQLAHVDDRTKAAWQEGVAAGLKTSAELWAHTRSQIVAGRALANRAGGYGVLNGDPASADFVEYGRISASSVVSLLLFSDGLYMPKPPGESDRDSAAEIASLVREMGLPRYHGVADGARGERSGLHTIPAREEVR